MGKFMLKLFYKTLLVSVLSSSLLIMDMTAFAQTATSNMSKTGYTRGADGNYTKTETLNLEAPKKNNDVDNALEIITMLAVGVLGTRLLMYPKFTTDMSVVAAASAAYLAGEVMNLNDLKKETEALQQEIKISTDAKSNQTQIEALQKLKESYQKMKDSAANKKMFQEAAAVLYLAGMGIAAYQSYTEHGLFAACASAISGTTGPLGIASDADYTCASCIPIMTSTLELANLLNSYKEIVGPTVKKVPEFLTNKAAFEASLISCIQSPTGLSIIKAATAAPCNAWTASFAATHCGPLAPELFYTSNGSANNAEKLLFANASMVMQPERMSVDKTLGFKYMLQKALDAFIPKAEASWNNIFGLGAAALVTFLAVKTSFGTALDTLMFTPTNRAIAWTVMSGLAYSGAKATENEMKIMENHIQKINQILVDLNRLSTGVQASNVNEQQMNIVPPIVPAASIPVGTNPAARTNCLVGSGDTNCSSLSNTLANMPGFSNLPDAFQRIASQGANLGDGLSGQNSISGTTMTTAGQIVAGGAAIRKLTDSVKNKLFSAGISQANFNKRASDFGNQLRAGAASALKKNNMSAGAFLSSIGMSPTSSANASIASKPTEGKSTKASKGGAGAAVTAAPKEKGFELKLDEAPNAAVAVDAGGVKAKEEKYDIGTNDINTNNGESIFQLISNRYIKSGYPRLLEEVPAAK